jgi:hypothetical protein
MAPRNKRINRNTNNPANPQHNLFQRLTRLFSGPIINYRQQQIRKDRRNRLDRYSRKFKSTSGQDFKKQSYNPYDYMMAQMAINQNRAERYADFDQMEFSPELSSALDIYADEITHHSEYGKILKIDCRNEEIKEILNGLLYQILNVEFNLFGWTRNLVKYGDFFLYLDIDEEIGIKSVIGLPSQEVERMEGEDPTNPNYIQYQWNSAGMTLENWQVGHFRILGNDKYAPYGTSILDPARRIWRQLTLLEDAMMAHRIVRAPDRRAFYVDVGGIPPEDVEQYMQGVMTSMKRHQSVNHLDGRVDLRYNPASIEEDYFVPVRGGQKATEISTIGGQTWANDIEDVKYLREKLFSAIKIPAAYLISQEAASEDKTTLAQKDIRFARTIQRLQRSIISELEKIAIIHLYTLGYKGEDLISFKFHLYNPSKIAQLQDIEQWKAKIEAADAAATNYFSKRWIAENMLNISEEEFVRNQRERFYDKKLEASMAKIAEVTGEVAGMEAAGGLGMGDMGGMPDLGATEDLGAPDLGGAEETAPTPTPEEEPTLLATPPEAGPPGKRDEDSSWYWKRVKKNPLGLPDQTTTARAKGKWYQPVTLDGRKSSGPRKKNMMSQGGHAQGGRRGTHKGYHELDNMRHLARGIAEGSINELLEGTVSSEEPNYDCNIEKNIFQTSNELKMLIESLENKNNEVKAQ